MNSESAAFRHIRVEPMTPNIGAMISGVDLNAVRSPEVYDEIKQALWKHHVVFFRDQPLKPDAHVALGAVFGDMERHEFFPSVDGHPEIQVISHQGHDAPETDRWHADVTFRERPSLVTVLRSVKPPPSGGDTIWASAAAAFDALAPALQTMLLSLEAVHDLPWSFRKSDNYRKFERDRERDGKRGETAKQHELRMVGLDPRARHPAVITHPHTGRPILFVNGIWTKNLVGIPDELSEALLSMLYEWIKKPEFMVRFRWEKDSIAIWDNFATQHYAVFDYAPHYREMNRVTAGSERPLLDRSRIAGAVRPRAWGDDTGQGIVDTRRLANASARERAAVAAIFDAIGVRQQDTATIKD